VDCSDDWKGLTTMVNPEGGDPATPGSSSARNSRDPTCGRTTRLRNTANPGLYHDYFKNRYGEQFVFSFDRATGVSTISGDDLGWDRPKYCTVGLLDEALRSGRQLAAQVVGLGRTEAAGLSVIDAALARGRLTDLTGKHEVIWLTAYLAACIPIAGPVIPKLNGPRRLRSDGTEVD
jgi:hypothetical protein